MNGLAAGTRDRHASHTGCSLSVINRAERPLRGLLVAGALYVLAAGLACGQATVDCDPDAAAVTNAFAGCYYGSKDLTDLRMARLDAAINFSWGKTSPDQRIGDNHFSVRWIGSFPFDDGYYTFNVVSDDGVRLYIDGELVLDKWLDHVGTYAVTRQMSSGVHHIRVEYFESEENAVIRVSWARNPDVAVDTDQRRDADSLQGPLVDIRDHGAVCDGATNDAEAVVSAIRAVPQAGGTVIVPCLALIGPPGIVVHERSRITIRGASPGTGFKAYVGTGPWTFGDPILLVLRACYECEVRDMLFEGENVPVGILRVERSEGTVIENNEIRNTGKTATAAMMGMGGRRNRYVRNTIDKTASEMRGIWIGNPGADMEHDPVVIENTVRHAAASGLVAGAISGGLIAHNRVEDNAGAGLKIEPLPGDSKTVVIEHNTAVRNLWSGITIGGPPHLVMRVSVRHNQVESGLQTGISLDSTTTGDVSDNRIFNNNRNMPQGALGGMYIIQAKDLVVERNRLYDTNPLGAPQRQDHGILVSPRIANGVTNLTIRNNRFENHKLDGIRVQAGPGSSIDGVTITGNSFIGNSQAGVNINESTLNTIRNITVFNNCFSGNARNIVDTLLTRLSQAPSFEACPDNTGP